MRIMFGIGAALALGACAEAESGESAAAGVGAMESESVAEDPAIAALTGPQKNARRSAESYLRMSGFSRKGLIEQLSSDAGEGYELADATAAVDTLNVDWKEQAARSAKSYIEMMPMSCNGLIDQLSSDAGEGYTAEEATYGAQQTDAC